MEDSKNTPLAHMEDAFVLYELLRDENGETTDLLCVEGNRSFERLAALKNQKVDGLKHSEILGTPDSYWLSLLDDVDQKQEPIRQELYIQKAGKVFEVQSFPAGNRQIGCIFTDTTGRQIFEQRIRYERDRAQSYLDVAEVLILVLDTNGKIELINRKGCEILNRKQEYILGKNWFDAFLQKDVARRSRRNLNELIENKGKASRYLEVEIKRGENEFRQIAFYNTVLLDQHGNVTGTLSSGADVTYRRQIEEELTRALTDLARSNNELREFVYVASHDLKAPLRTIASFLGLLKERASDRLNDKENSFIDHAVRGSLRLNSLIDDLLIYSRLDAREDSEKVDLNRMFDETLLDLELQIKEKNATITRQDLPLLRCRPNAIRQIFQNLLGNALKYASVGIAPKVELRWSQTETEVVFEMQDNGVGIPKEYRDTVFKVFRRLEHEGSDSGTGIGLAICKKVIEAHRGQIHVHSAPERGSIFRFSFPLKLVLTS